MSLNHKSFQIVGFKVLDSEQGIIEAFVSVFNNVDAAKERIRPGFFNKSLQRKLPKGVWMHDWKQPIAKTLEAKEVLAGDAMLPPEIKDFGGLYIKGHINLGTQRGRDAHSDLSFGTVDEFSIGYETTKESFDAGSGVTDLIEGNLYEWSPVLVGCNDRTALVSVKGLYLGDYVESSMTMSALYTLENYLYYFISDKLYDDDVPLEQRMTAIRGAFDEFRDIALRTIEAIMSGQSQEDAETAVKTIKALWPDPKESKAGSRAGLVYVKHSETALAAVQGWTNRTKELKELRTKEGRTLSSANRQRLQQCLDSLTDLEQELTDLLASTDDSSEKSLPSADQLYTEFVLTCTAIELAGA
ncbi:MAG: HK97 family phage prohead protease [Pyrinomonadaceae bacterium]